MFTGRQFKAALALIGVPRSQFGRLVGVSPKTIQRIAESENEIPNTSAKTMNEIKVYLESQGVMFLDQNIVSSGPGVCLTNIQGD